MREGGRNNPLVLFFNSLREEDEVTETEPPKNPFEEKLKTLVISEKNKLVLQRKIQQQKNCCSSDKTKQVSWLEQAMNLPFQRTKMLIYDNKTRFMIGVMHNLNENVYGMKSAKEQIMLYLNAKLDKSDTNVSLGLLGPPGCGKTMLSRTLATAIGLPFKQITCGGLTNADTLKGHDLTFVGSQPGEISRSMMEMKYKNGIIFFDEFEKVADKPEITSLLLHITDPAQNMEYKDNYFIDLDIDLSCVWFMYSMNEEPKDQAQKDRMLIIDVSSYTYDEKIIVVKDYMLKVVLRELGLTSDQIQLPHESARFIIDQCQTNCSLREVKRVLVDIIYKINFIAQHSSQIDMSFNIKNLSYPITITPSIIEKIVGELRQPKYLSYYM